MSLCGTIAVGRLSTVSSDRKHRNIVTSRHKILRFKNELIQKSLPYAERPRPDGKTRSIVAPISGIAQAALLSTPSLRLSTLSLDSRDVVHIMRVNRIFEIYRTRQQDATWKMETHFFVDISKALRSKRKEETKSCRTSSTAPQQLISPPTGKYSKALRRCHGSRFNPTVSSFHISEADAFRDGAPDGRDLSRVGARSSRDGGRSSCRRNHEYHAQQKHKGSNRPRGIRATAREVVFIAHVSSHY